jgi:Mannose-6-phosphate isomerase
MGEIRLKKVAIDEVASNRRRGGDIRVLLSPKTVDATSGFMGVLRLRPGERVTEHYHPYSEEFIYVVRGSVIVRIDGDQDLKLSPGDGLMVPKEVRHSVRNTGVVEAFLVFHLSPLAPRPELGHVDTEPAQDENAPHVPVGGVP